MSTKDRWLLPEGVEETLPAEARRLEQLRRAILDLFERWGYELVMPPLIEYLESLQTGVGKDLDLQTFKLIDQLTGRLMGVRPDMTPQAARIDAHYLKREHVTRLCYLGPVLRTRPDEFAGSREPLQFGAELYGHAGPESDAEVLTLMVATLALAGVATPHIDLAHVGVFRALAERAGLDRMQEYELLEAIQRKSKADVEALLAQTGAAATHRRQFVALLTMNGGAEILTHARREYGDIPQVTAAIAYLDTVIQRVRRELPALELHIDLAELGGYHYYTGVLFSAFVPTRGQAIAKGGRYDGIGRAFGRERAATGFGADLRVLLTVGATPAATVSGIYAPADDDAELVAEINRLRAQGERVVRALPGDTASAMQLGCDRQLVRKSNRWVSEPVRR